MKKTLFLLFCTATCLAQESYTRKNFDYPKLKVSTENCSEATNNQLNTAFEAIEQNNSSKAVQISEKLFKAYDCPEAHEAYAVSLFRSGEVIEGVELIEAAIEKFGSNPQLIKRKSLLLLELFENGTGQRNIDGNAVYKAKNEKLNYDEEKFKIENLNTALNDLIYLTETFEDTQEEIYIIGKIYQSKNEFEKSNEQFLKIVEIPEFKSEVVFNIAENYIGLKNYTLAEEYLLKLLESYPNEPQLLSKFSELYQLAGETSKSELFNKKRYFHQLVPSFCEMEFSEKNLETISFFNDQSNDYKSKINKLKEIEKNESQNFTIETCIAILNIHANHGNGLEDDAAKMLTKIGIPSLDKVHQLFNARVSTCTITNLAEIMASLKDESSWQVMADYIPQIANMPSTLIPPNVPEYLIKFNEERGLREILKIVKPMVTKDTQNDAMTQLSFMNEYIYFSPLEKISFKKIEAICKDLGYDKNELNELKKTLK
ncbi:MULTISPECIES: tetratricopeptide repeat protein [unclassified Flavobacterium]|uniref:tetratricopeptide repeat protein n=1 Tax=unclassified Flavobacterium TaxID=196869 RepID=UPI00361671B5